MNRPASGSFLAFALPLIFLHSLTSAPGPWLAVEVTQQPAPDTSPLKFHLHRSPAVWSGPDREPLPFENDSQLEEFLLTSQVVDQEKVSEGINRIPVLVLENRGVRLRGAWRTVDIDKVRERMADGTTVFNFRDCYLFEVAAYRLNRMLGLHNVPPVVERSIRKKRGSLQYWVENVVMEKDRREEGRTSPNAVAWLYQNQTVLLFDALIYNDDRNLGNLLIDEDWKIWMIDHTRAFRRYSQPKSLKEIKLCDREVLQRLQELDRATLKSELGKLLKGAEIDALLRRRDSIVGHIERLIQEKGSAEVLF